MDTTLLKKYAQLVIKTGVNLQKDQLLVINAPIECAEFARMLSELAYLEGAQDVIISWKDELSSKIRFLHAPETVFSQFPEWQKELYVGYAQQGAAFVGISASDPELMKDIDPQRIATAQKTMNTALKEYRERIMSHRNPWCIVSIPTRAWARKVFPDMDDADAIDHLWEAILQSVRVDRPDPVAAWDQHKADLKQRMDFLNARRFTKLHYTNSIGTDLVIELPVGHLWVAGAERTPTGHEFIANMPTEEVFTLPNKTGVNGTVVSSKPLNYNGNLIDGFMLRFVDGKVVESSAAVGEEVLKNLLETDAGACYIGEVALVPYDSPISNLGILFYNTLFDENASCHLAFGKAYPICLKGGIDMNADELVSAGANDSLVHVDFMIGTSDLRIVGTDIHGEDICIFENGNFAF